MKSKIAIILVLLLVIPSLGCFSNDEDEGPSMAQTIKDHTAQIASLRSDVNKKADQSTVDALTKLIGGGSQADTYTKAQADAQIKSAVDAAISKLKTDADQSWIKSATYTTPAGTTAGEYGELVDTDGDLELWLEKTSGDVSDVFVTRDGVCSGRFDLIVVNKDTGSSHDYRISLALTPESDVVLMDSAVSFSTTKNFITASGGMLFTMSRVNSARNPLNAYQTNEDRITKGTTEDVTVWLTVEQESSSSAITEWEYSIKIDDRD